MRNNWALTWRMNLGGCSRVHARRGSTVLCVQQAACLPARLCLPSSVASAARIELHGQVISLSLIHPHLLSAGGLLQLILPVDNKIHSSLATPVCGKAAVAEGVTLLLSSLGRGAPPGSVSQVPSPGSAP